MAGSAPVFCGPVVHFLGRCPPARDRERYNSMRHPRPDRETLRRRASGARPVRVHAWCAPVDRISGCASIGPRVLAVRHTKPAVIIRAVSNASVSEMDDRPCSNVSASTLQRRIAEVRRAGPTTKPLVVAYTTHGDATSKSAAPPLSSTVTITVGSDTTILVTPNAAHGAPPLHEPRSSELLIVLTPTPGHETGRPSTATMRVSFDFDILGCPRPNANAETAPAVSRYDTRQPRGKGRGGPDHRRGPARRRAEALTSFVVTPPRRSKEARGAGTGLRGWGQETGRSAGLAPSGLACPRGAEASRADQSTVEISKRRTRTRSDLGGEGLGWGA